MGDSRPPLAWFLYIRLLNSVKDFVHTNNLRTFAAQPEDIVATLGSDNVT